MAMVAYLYGLKRRTGNGGKGVKDQTISIHVGIGSLGGASAADDGSASAALACGEIRSWGAVVSGHFLI
jgi:hypothetical protein